MSKMQLFNFDDQQVRTVLVDDVPYFVAKDVTNVLGYKDCGEALKKHVDDEDKVSKIVNESQIPQNTEIVNDSQKSGKC